MAGGRALRVRGRLSNGRAAPNTASETAGSVQLAPLTARYAVAAAHSARYPLTNVTARPWMREESGIGLPEYRCVILPQLLWIVILDENIRQKESHRSSRMLLALVVIAALQSASVEDPAAVQKQLRADDQALLDAIAPGDRSVWERLLAKDAVYVDENGAVMHREQFLAALKPLPPGTSGHITIVEYEASIRDQVALLVHKDDERENYHGIPLRADYLMTETWIKEGGDWRLALVHVYFLPKDRPAIKITANRLAEYRNRYR